MRKSLLVVLGLCCFFFLFAGTSYAATSYTVQPGDTLYLISQDYGLTPQQLIDANGLTSSDIYPGQVLTIPTATQSGSGYTVKPGDTLYLIAQRYGTTVAALVSSNNLTTTEIYPGQVLTIPAAGNHAGGTPGAATASQYTVKPGDTLYLIAINHGTTADAIMSANGLSDTMIYPGQVLMLPNGSSGGGASPPAAGSASQYTVAPGDSLYLIAINHGTTVDALMSTNGLSSTEIYPGQVLLLPNGSSAANGGAAGGSSTVSRGSGSFSAQDIYLLAQLIHAEAQGEIYEGQVAVGAVVLNRLRDPRFPKTISGVIYDQWQFECVQNGTINQAPDATARQAANAAIQGWDPSWGALYFYNPDKVQDSYFTSNLTYIRRIGNHVFYK